MEKFRYGVELRFSKIFEVEAETLEDADKKADELVNEEIKQGKEII